MSRKPKTLDELEQEIDAAEDGDLAAPASSIAQREHCDRIFTKSQAKAVMGCLQHLARDRGLFTGRLIDVYWRQILSAAHGYKEHREEPSVPMKNEIRRLVRRFRREHGEYPMVAVRIMGGGKPGLSRRGRHAYIAAVCDIYKKLTGRSRWPGRRDLLDLLRACLAPSLFFERGRPLQDNTITMAIKRIRGAPRLLLTRHLFDDPEEHRRWMTKCKQARLARGRP